MQQAMGCSLCKCSHDGEEPVMVHPGMLHPFLYFHAHPDFESQVSNFYFLTITQNQTHKQCTYQRVGLIGFRRRQEALKKLLPKLSRRTGLDWTVLKNASRFCSCGSHLGPHCHSPSPEVAWLVRKEEKDQHRKEGRKKTKNSFRTKMPLIIVFFLSRKFIFIAQKDYIDFITK